MASAPNFTKTATPDDAPSLGRIPAWAHIPLTALWVFAFVGTLGAQAGGSYFAWLAELPLFELLAEHAIGLAAALALLATAWLLRRRDARDPVGWLLSMSSLCAAAYVGPATTFYLATGLEILGTLLPSLWIGFLVAALPALPDGRYVPAWGRWLTRLAIPFTLAISADTMTEDEGVILATTFLGFGVAFLAILAAVQRFRRTPPGLERQQLKWAALGVASCIALLIVAITLSYAADAELFPEDWLPWLGMLVLAMRDASFLLLAAGLAVSLLRLRLWDADRAIGRSVVYFILTIVVACVWAASAALITDFVSGQVGGANKGMVAAISTIIALLILGPARERVNKWVEQRLQRGIVQLRGLPERLAVWQHLDDPTAFGERVAGAVSSSLHAPDCAVLLFEDGRFRPLAAVGASREKVARWIEAQDSFADLAAEQPDDAAFPLRLILIDEEVMIGALLVGPRSDGSYFAKEERAALLKLEPPLAAALNRVHTKVETNRALAGLDTRLGRIEETVGTGATTTKESGHPPRPPLEDVPPPS